MPSNPVVEKLRETEDVKGIKILSTGIRVLIPTMSTFEMQEMALSIADPPPVYYVDEETGREVENPNDPAYAAALQMANIKRGLMTLEAILIGVTLVDGLPEDTSWIEMLRFKHKRGIINLDSLNLENPLELEFAYKKYIAFKTTEDWAILQGKMNEVGESAKKADAVFPSDEERTADSTAPTKA